MHEIGIMFANLALLFMRSPEHIVRSSSASQLRHTSGAMSAANDGGCPATAAVIAGRNVTRSGVTGRIDSV